MQEISSDNCQNPFNRLAFLRRTAKDRVLSLSFEVQRTVQITTLALLRPVTLGILLCVLILNLFKK